VGPVAATTIAKEDIDGGPSRGCCWWVRQRPPLKLKKMSMVAPLGVLLASSSVATTKVGEDVDGIIWPLGGGSDHIMCLNMYWFL
jgi:hypothetical protein